MLYVDNSFTFEKGSKTLSFMTTQIALKGNLN